MTISRGQMPRQLYGLGSLVKKITKPIKKLAKSDLGKAALFAAPFIPFAGPGTSLFSKFGETALGQGLGKFFTENALGKVIRDVGVGSLVGGGLDYFQRRSMPEPEMRIQGRTAEEIAEIERELRQNYENLGYEPGEIDLLVEQNMREYRAEGGRIGFALGPDKPETNAVQAAGIEGLPLNENPAGVTELDLRETGGFIPPVGVKEKADDIPAMLSNNEFVMTADAVREFGDGDVDKGAERMYAMMKQLENGRRI